MMGWCCFCFSVETIFGGKSVAPLPMGITLRGHALGVTLFNITASSLSADLGVYNSVTNGTDNTVLRRACIKSCAACITESVEDIFGMMNISVKKPTVSDLLSDFFCNVCFVVPIMFHVRSNVPDRLTMV